MSEWISVKDRLPEDRQEVLVLLRNGYLIINAKYFAKETSGYICVNTMEEKAMWFKSNDGTAYSVSCEPTHWMPLPQPPKEQAEND